MTHTNFSLGISSTAASATPTAAKTLTPPTALKQLDNLVREVKDPQLRRVLQAVFGEPHVQGDILAAHFASHRDPVVVEPENHFAAPTAQHSAESESPQPRLRYVHFYEFETDPRQSSVACPNIAQIQLVARLARDTGGTNVFERELLYVGAALHGLVMVGIRHQGLNVNQAREEMRAWVRAPLSNLEALHFPLGYRLRLALGLGSDEDQCIPQAQRYVDLIANAWLRSDRTVAWRRHVVSTTTSVAPTESGPAPVDGVLDPAPVVPYPWGAKFGVADKGIAPKVVRPTQGRPAPAQVRVGWDMVERFGSGRLADMQVQVKAEVDAFFQANPQIVRNANGIM